MITTKNYGNAEIIGDGSKYNYVRVRFINTGNIDEFRKDAVERGEIRDKWAVTFCGVGIIGDIKTRGKNKRYYTLWRNMIKRCYDNSNVAYENVSVCERWHVFQYFYDDIHFVDGFDEAMFDSGELELDKDIKQRFFRDKVYSLETCCFVRKSINCTVQDGQQREFVGISPSGDVYRDTNITSFARTHGLERRQISAVLHGKFKSTLGWKFHYSDEEIV